MRYATIGGQAVIEGVMMRNGNDYAVAVRKPDQTIEVKKDQYIGLNARWHMKKIPIIRGVLSFIDSLVLGMSTLTYSASFFEDEEEAEKAKAKDSTHSFPTYQKYPKDEVNAADGKTDRRPPPAWSRLLHIILL